jgi:hypothetical protein
VICASHEIEGTLWVFHAIAKRLLQYIEAGRVPEQKISELRPPIPQLVKNLEQARKGEKNNSIAMLYTYVWRANGYNVPDASSVFRPCEKTLLDTEREHINNRHTIIAECSGSDNIRRPCVEDEDFVFQCFDHGDNVLGTFYAPVNTCTIIGETAILYRLGKGYVEGNWTISQWGLDPEAAGNPMKHIK